jgi:hypothetical protein
MCHVPCVPICVRMCVYMCVCHVCTCACAMMRQVTCVAKCAHGICVRAFVYVQVACACSYGMFHVRMWHNMRMCHVAYVPCGMWVFGHVPCACVASAMCTCHVSCGCACAFANVHVQVACGIMRVFAWHLAYYAICSCGIWRVCAMCVPCAYVPCGMCGIIWASCARGCGMLYAPYKHVANAMWASCAMCLCGTCTCHTPFGMRVSMCVCACAGGMWHAPYAHAACGVCVPPCAMCVCVHVRATCEGGMCACSMCHICVCGMCHVQVWHYVACVRAKRACVRISASVCACGK